MVAYQKRKMTQYTLEQQWSKTPPDETDDYEHEGGEEEASIDNAHDPLFRSFGTSPKF